MEGDHTADEPAGASSESRSTASPDPAASRSDAPPSTNRPLPPGHSPPSGYGAPPSYGASAGYGASPGYGPPPGYGVPTGSSGAPGYGANAGYSQPAYGGYGYGYGPPPRKTNGMAITSLVLGLIAFATCPIVSIAALVIGYMARKRIRETGEDGAGMALAGVILGWIGTGLTILVVLFYIGLGIFAVSTSSNSSSSGSRSRFQPISTTSTTSVRGLEPRGTRPPGSTAAPSGVIPAASCASATLALQSLFNVQISDKGIVTDAARTLHQVLPAAYGDDIDIVLADALNRVDRNTTGSRSPEVSAAANRLDAIVVVACPQ